MMTRIATLSAIVLASLVAGCSFGSSSPYVPARITAVTDPAYHNRRFTNIAVVADTADLGWRLKLEKWLAETLRAKGTGAVEGATIIPPTRRWDPASAHGAFTSYSIDAYLTLEIIASGEWATNVPLTTSTTVTREQNTKKNSEGDSTKREEVTVTTTTKQEGGYTQHTPWTRYAIRLVDVATGDVAWMATNDINGDPDDRIWSFCQEVIAQLQRDGLIRGDSLVVKTGG